MTAPRPEIQRWTTSLDAPFARKGDGEIVLYADHLRFVTLAKIEVLEEMPVATVETKDGKVHLAGEHERWVRRKIAALRKDLGDE